MEPQSHLVRGVATGPLQGVGLTAYFVLLPYVLATKWRFSYTVTNGAMLRDLLVGLGIFWVIFLVLVTVYVNQLRHRRTLPTNGCAWLAGLVVLALPFLVSANAGAAVVSRGPARPATAAHALAPSSGPRAAFTPTTRAPHSRPASSDSPVSLFAAALMAKGRRDRGRDASERSDEEIDEIARRLHDTDDRLIGQLRDVIGSSLDGQTTITDDDAQVDARVDFDPVVVSILEQRSDALIVGYAREGGTLPVNLAWSAAELTARLVALHDGTVVFADNDNQLVRALARRRGLSTLVVYVGEADELDDELRGLCVTLGAAQGTSWATSRLDTEVGSTRGPATTTRATAGTPGPPVRVELLRAYPQVQGLAEDFTATLRRRCIEMVAYLAMHGGEPVTGDRLRSRVLVNANVDASKTTLSNTASSVRRSLGSDDEGPLLQPVSSGLYRVRAVGLDVAEFHQLVARGRANHGDDAVALYVEALRLVHGEPLASVLKGFEWFTFEGHRAQLQRDGEWVALALHDAALARDDVETAFWSLRQGLLLDPDSEELLDALGRVPRLRQFRGDGTSTAQHHAVGPGRAVAMSWAFERFSR